MKKIAILSAFLFFTTFTFAQEGDVAKVGESIPTFSLSSDKFGEVKPADLQGKVVLVTLFATWCGPCQKELAEFESTLYPKYKDNSNFKLLVIGREHSNEEIDKYLARKGFSFPIYPDTDRSVTDLFATKFIPRCYLINKAGKIVYASQGFDKVNFDKMLERIDGLLQDQ